MPKRDWLLPVSLEQLKQISRLKKSREPLKRTNKMKIRHLLMSLNDFPAVKSINFHQLLSQQTKTKMMMQRSLQQLPKARRTKVLKVSKCSTLLILCELKMTIWQEIIRLASMRPRKSPLGFKLMESRLEWVPNNFRKLSSSWTISSNSRRPSLVSSKQIICTLRPRRTKSWVTGR